MLFNSLDFAVFLMAVLLIYAAIPRPAWGLGKAFLVVASYAFYMAWNPPFGLLLLFSTIVDFTIGRAFTRVTSPGARRGLVLTSVIVNLGVLSFFKYGSFFAESGRAALGMAPLPPESFVANVVLPVGISFYTFQTLSYTIDVYRGTREPAESALDFMLYVSFFPQLVAGPIVRSTDFLPQLRTRPRVDGPMIEDALSRIAMGLFKKVVLADTLALLVDETYGDLGAASRGNAILATYAYAFQIYFDFSGYSDIAIGVAQLFGIRIPENFNRPYWATSPREFWRRWHISLSTWLRDYLYIPLGGNRHGTVRLYANLAITMLLGGLWHGAAWTYVIWGGYHGLLLAGERWARDRDLVPTGPFATWGGRLVTFHLVGVGWVVFRSGSMSTLGEFASALARPGLDVTPAVWVAAIALVLSIAAHCAWSASRLRRWHTGWPPALQGAGYAVLAALVFIFSPATERFIYFQF